MNHIIIMTKFVYMICVWMLLCTCSGYDSAHDVCVSVCEYVHVHVHVHVYTRMCLWLSYDS